MRFIFSLLVIISCANQRSNNVPFDEKGMLLSPVNEGDVELVYVDHPQTLPHNALIGGTPAKPEDFPANFYTSQGNSRCSGTLLGERVLISAAHCMGDGKTATLTYKGEKYVGTCTHHPEYKSNATADWSLCYLDKPAAGFPFEKMLLDLSVLKVGGKVQLSGFGCVNQGGGGGNDGVFRFGEAVIQNLPSGNDNDTVTKGGAALCFGDSGGSAYVYVGDDRFMFAVNSRGDIKTTSYLVTFTDKMKTWAAAWAAPKAAKICGLHSDAPNCRNVKPPDPPSQCELAYKKVGECIFKNIAKTEPDACLKAYAGLSACLEEAGRVD